MNDSRCIARTKAGTRCGNRAIGSDGKCFAHSDAFAEQRRQGRIEGGQNKATEKRIQKRIPEDIRGTLDTLFRTLQGLEDGTVEPARASAIASVSRAIVSTWEVGVLEAKVREMEQRLQVKPEPTPFRKDNVA
jgi:hypothetical protein